MDLLRRGRTGYDRGDRLMRKKPGDRQLKDGVSPRFRKFDEPFHRIELLWRDLGASGQAAVRRRLSPLPIFARKKPAREREVGQESHTQLFTSIQDAALRIAVEKVELILHADEP